MPSSCTVHTPHDFRIYRRRNRGGIRRVAPATGSRVPASSSELTSIETIVGDTLSIAASLLQSVTGNFMSRYVRGLRGLMGFGTCIAFVDINRNVSPMHALISSRLSYLLHLSRFTLSTKLLPTSSAMATLSQQNYLLEPIDADKPPPALLATGHG